MENKRVLYIGTPFFGYYKHIIKEFENQGYSVDYYNDRPSENAFIKGLIKIKKSLVNNIINEYFKKILSETKSKKYDLVFIVNCKVFSSDMINDLKESQKSAKFILYMWDSIELYPNVNDLIPSFDKVYSFDLDDCEKIEMMNFLPLFYCKEYEQIGSDNTQEIMYDILSVCTAHPNRYKMMSKLFPQLESKGIKVFSYMFLNKFQYLYNKVFVNEFKKAKMNEFKFIPLSYEENLKAISQSKSIFDMQHNKQSGLTMRTVETLGAKRKLITSNTNIKRYDFYNENNIFILEDECLEGIDEFISKNYEDINQDIYEKYSLRSWIETIVNEKKNNYLK